MNLLLFWIIFNIFISIYELYIIKNRNLIKKEKCMDSFWSTYLKNNKKNQNNKSNFFLDGWIEYTCNTDERYFDPNHYVYVFEFFNVISTFLLITFYKYKNYNFLYCILLFQLINCVFYFMTLDKLNSNKKTIPYLFISYLWILIPSYLIFSHKKSFIKFK